MIISFVTEKIRKPSGNSTVFIYSCFALPLAMCTNKDISSLPILLTVMLMSSWGTHHTWYATPAVSYLVIYMARNGKVQRIEIQNVSSCLSLWTLLYFSLYLLQFSWSVFLRASCVAALVKNSDLLTSINFRLNLHFDSFSELILLTCFTSLMQEKCFVKVLLIFYTKD